MKKPNHPYKRVTGFALALLWVVLPAFSQTRLDLYDAQDNHLMFVKFEYDGTGKNSGRSVFMSDSTFVRSITVNTNAQGNRVSETSFNFNGDTVFQSTFGTSGSASTIATRDQFGLDQFGSPVSAASAGDMQFDLSQAGSLINKVTYEKDNQDSLKRVTVSDANNTPLYYGIFSYGVDGVVVPGRQWALRSTIETNGRGALVLRVSLDKPSAVRCELLSLSGRRVGVMLDGRFPKGAHRRLIPLVSPQSRVLSLGVYCVTLSIDGRTVAVKRLLVQDREAGIR